MRIAIDARELRPRPTGVGRYLTEVLRAWGTLQAAADHDFVLCAPGSIPCPVTSLRLTLSVASGGSGTLWEQLVLPRLVSRAGADVLFAPAYTGPLWTRVPLVLAVHDVSFAAHPEWFPWREGIRRRVVTRLAARRAARILTLTRHARQEIVRHLGVDAGTVVVTSAGVTRVGALTTGEPGRARGSSEGRDRPRILFVGSVFTRRHLPELIAAIARLRTRAPGVSLDVVGENRTSPRVDLAEEARRAGIADIVRIHAYVAEERLAELYRQADAFAWLSSYEGFGLPPLEALAAGVPVLALETPVSREVLGEAATFVRDVQPESVAAGLERVLFDGRERQRTATASEAVLGRHSWAACAARVLEAVTAAGR
jgi:glycosyltransferase involved in cell wall biosynthesis